jgi:hypothetical protein
MVRVKSSGALSLKTLTMARCGRDIQKAGKRGHDSLEDAIAARDLAHWNIVNVVLRMALEDDMGRSQFH